MSKKTGELTYPENKMGTVDTLPKKGWGPKFWRCLHLMAESFPLEPTEYDKIRYREWLSITLELLPCMECRKHANQYMQENPINFKTREEFAMYVYNFHNEVNRRLGKPIISMDEYKAIRSRCWSVRESPKPSIIVLTLMALVLIAIAAIAGQIYYVFY